MEAAAVLAKEGVECEVRGVSVGSFPGVGKKSRGSSHSGSAKLQCNNYRLLFLVNALTVSQAHAFHVSASDLSSQN